MNIFSLSKAVLCLILLSSSNISAASNHDVSRYIEIVSGGHWTDKVNLYKYLYKHSDINEPKLFDLIDHQLRAISSEELSDKRKVMEYTWAIKALVSSGNTKYQPTLDKLATSAKTKDIRKTAKKQKRLIQKYSKLNKVASSNEYTGAERSEREAYLLRLLNSSDYKLAAESLKTAINELSYSDPEYINQVKIKLTSLYRQTNQSDESISFQSWACKYLGMQSKENYKLLYLVETEATNNKVRKWARVARTSIGQPAFPLPPFVRRGFN